MTDASILLQQRRETLAAEIEELAKNKFFRFMALSYCCAFIERAIKDSSSPLEDNPVHFQGYDLEQNIGISEQQLLEKADRYIDDNFETLETYEQLPHSKKVANYIRSQLFISLMSELEDFLSQTATLILLAYPCQIDKKYGVDEVVKLDNIEGLISDAVEAEVLKIFAAKKPLQYIKDIERIFKVNQTMADGLKSVWFEYIEMKARRDVGVHNGWRRSNQYDKKIAEVGLSVPNETFLGVDWEYFRKALDTAIDIIAKCNVSCNLAFSNIEQEADEDTTSSTANRAGSEG